MKLLKSVAGINIIGLLLYLILIRLFYGHDALNAMIVSAVAIGLHVVICVLLSVVFFLQKDKEFGRSWLGAAGLVLLIGFSVCLGNTAI